jgi:glycosyltransferase involved in cell wall biosynthesis
VVDDGSKDKTSRIVQDLADSRLKYFYKDNGERGAARNFGVKNAKGKYVFFLDSDDFLDSNHLELAYNKILALNQPEFLHLNFKQVDAFGNVLSKVPFPSSINTFIYNQNVFGVYFFLRRDIVLANPFDENRNFNIGEDWYLVLKIALHYPLHTYDLYTYNVLIHETRTMNMLKTDDLIRNMNLMVNNLRTNTLMPEYKIRLVGSNYYNLASLYSSLDGQKKSAVIFLVKAFFLSPISIFNRRTLAIVKHLMIGRNNG